MILELARDGAFDGPMAGIMDPRRHFIRDQAAPNHEKFDRQKVLEGLLKACEKRPVPMAKLAEVVDEVESKLSDTPDREMATSEVGELLMKKLVALDKIAYVRFASVYRDFQDVEAFLAELKDLLQKRG